MNSFKKKDASDTATLGGGCFWCVEAILDNVKGVVSAVSGYAGGKRKRQHTMKFAMEILGMLK